MSFFKKKKNVKDVVVDNHENWVVENNDIETIKHETISHDLYDETIVTKRVKVRCKICGIYMYVNHTKVIKTPRKFEILESNHEFENEEIEKNSSELHENVYEEPIIIEQEEVVELPVQEPEHLEVEEFVVEENQEKIQNEEYVLDEISEPINVEESEIQSLVFEDLEEPKQEFKPVNFEFVKPRPAYDGGVFYAEDNFLNSEYSERKKKRKIDTSLVDQYFRSYNLNDVSILEEMIHNNEVEKEYAFLVKNTDIDPYEETYLSVEDVDHSVKSKKKFSLFKNKNKKVKNESKESLLEENSSVEFINENEKSIENQSEMHEKVLEDILVDNEVEIVNNVHQQKEIIFSYKKKKTWWETEVYSKK